MRSTPPLVLGVGEILWDCMEDGRRPGGAPANVVFHANQLGARGVVCSRVGTDADGTELAAYLQQHDLELTCLQRDPTYPTSRAEIVRTGTQNQHFEIIPDVAWDHLEFDSLLSSFASKADAICFGTLAQRTEASRQTVERCLEAAPDNCLLVFDANLRPPWYDRTIIERSLHAADVVKLNLDELAEISDLFGFPGADTESAAASLQRTFKAEHVCITRGAAGCLLLDADELCDIPGHKVNVADTVGAGDAFTAAVIVGQLHAWPLRRIAEFANEVAACVACQSGAMAQIDLVLAEKASSNA